MGIFKELLEAQASKGSNWAKAQLESFVPSPVQSVQEKEQQQQQQESVQYGLYVKAYKKELTRIERINGGRLKNEYIISLITDESLHHGWTDKQVDDAIKRHLPLRKRR